MDKNLEKIVGDVSIMDASHNSALMPKLILKYCKTCNSRIIGHPVYNEKGDEYCSTKCKNYKQENKRLLPILSTGKKVPSDSR